MRTHFFSSQGLNPRKKGCRIWFLKHELASTLTLPTPDP